MTEGERAQNDDRARSATEEHAAPVNLPTDDTLGCCSYVEGQLASRGYAGGGRCGSWAGTAEGFSPSHFRIAKTPANHIKI